MTRSLGALLVLGLLAGCKKDADKDEFKSNVDCEDTDSAINPDAVEVCNGIDDDCNGAIDDAAIDPSIFYADVDGDAHGNPAQAFEACSAPPGWVTDATDCDDLDASAFPGATEVCDGADNNCDSAIDEGVQSTFFADSDGDGFGTTEATWDGCAAPVGFTLDSTDCDDTDVAAFPDNPEVCDGSDNDCDGSVDDGVMSTFHPDYDGDGFGFSAQSYSACEAPAGWVVDGTDCDDGNVANYPGNVEVCDGFDNDCSGLPDNGVLRTFYADADGDQYGASGSGITACTAPPGYVATSTDCNDGDFFTWPGAFESCDGVDSDCDGIVDNSGYDSDVDGIDNCNDPTVYDQSFATCDGASASWADWSVIEFADMAGGNTALGFPVSGTPTTPEAWDWCDDLSTGTVATGHSVALSDDLGDLNVYTLYAQVGSGSTSTSALGIVFSYVDDQNYYMVRWDDPNNAYTRNTRLELIRCISGQCAALDTYDNAATAGSGLTQFEIRVRYDAIDVYTGSTPTLRLSTITNGGDLGPGQIGAYVFDAGSAGRFDTFQITQP